MKNNSLWDRWAQTPPSVKIAILGVLVIWSTIVAALVAGVVLLRPGAEQALQPTPEMVIPKIALEPAAGPVGASVTVRGEGWPAGGTILIYLVPPGETERPSQATSSATADAQGRFTIQFWIPREPGWETQGLAVVIAQTTEGGLAAQAPFSVVKEPGQPTLTAVLSQTPSPTLTPSPMSPTATPLPGRPVATAITDLNIRAGPGMGYPVLGVLRAGQSAEITGASADGGWWQIRFSGVADPQGEGAPGRGWISARYVTAQDTQNVPVAQAPALPTTPTRVPMPTSLPTPTSTLASVSITDWRGEYYDNPDLRGSPTHVRNDVSVNFDWGAGAPAAGVDADNFSARWSRALDFSAGTYRFTVRADDGVRLWVDGALVIDQWHASSGTTYSTDVNLTHGMHTIRMEYYERGGQALARLAWERLDQYADWKAEYYSNSEMAGSPFLVRNESRISHQWGEGAPVPGIWVDNFSVRWTRKVNLEEGTYRLSVRVDDGVRLWIDDTLVIDNWGEGGSRFVEVERQISDGEHRVKVEYYEHGGDAYIEVAWQRQEEPTNRPPRAVPGGPYTVNEGQSIKFDGSESHDLDGKIAKFEWDFDYDGSTFTVDATGQKADTRYPDGPETVLIALRVTDDQGASHRATAQVTVMNVAPTAEAGGPYIGLMGSLISIAGTATDAGLIDQTGLIYGWDFGDGGKGSGPIVSHSYAQAGTYTLTLTVTDKDGAHGVDTAVAQVSAVNRPPTAAISGPVGGLVEELLSFAGGASSDSDGHIVSYAWDFGDGGLGSGITVTHAYTQPATYPVRLTVTDDDGLSDVATQTVQIQQPPRAIITSPKMAVVSQTLQFDGSGSSDDGDILSYVWDFGDGGLGSGITVTHAYTQPGTYPVRLTVTDDEGLSDQVTHIVRIGLPPTAVICGPPATVVSRTVQFNGSGSGDSDGRVISYTWDLGDGVFGGGVTTTHAYTQVGVYTVTLVVTDHDGLTGVATHTIQVDEPAPMNMPPTAVICGPTTVALSQTVQFDGSSSVDDVQIVSYAWDLGDGTIGSGVAVTHIYTQAGPYTVTLTVTDQGGLTGETTHTVQAGLPPTAVITGPVEVAVNQAISFKRIGSRGDGAWEYHKIAAPRCNFSGNQPSRRVCETGL